MSLQQIKKLNDQKGFTIVELLIVIVVIGILAAIVIVAYTGVTNRANATKAQTNSTQVQKVAEAVAADTANNGLYPTTTAGFNGTTAKMPSGVGLKVASGTPTAPNTTSALSATNGTTVVHYQTCDSGNGYKITYWDYSASTPAETTSTSGSGKYFTGGTTASCADPAS